VQHNGVAFLEDLLRLFADDGFTFVIFAVVVVAAVLAFGFDATPEIVAAVLVLGVRTRDRRKQAAREELGNDSTTYLLDSFICILIRYLPVRDRIVCRTKVPLWSVVVEGVCSKFMEASFALPPIAVSQGRPRAHCARMRQLDRPTSAFC
jgi:hypothetical protein